MKGSGKVKKIRLELYSINEPLTLETNFKTGSGAEFKLVVTKNNASLHKPLEDGTDGFIKYHNVVHGGYGPDIPNEAIKDLKNQIKQHKIDLEKFLEKALEKYIPERTLQLIDGEKPIPLDQQFNIFAKEFINEHSVGIKELIEQFPENISFRDSVKFGDNTILSLNALHHWGAANNNITWIGSKITFFENLDEIAETVKRWTRLVIMIFEEYHSGSKNN